MARKLLSVRIMVYKGREFGELCGVGQVWGSERGVSWAQWSQYNGKR